MKAIDKAIQLSDRLEKIGILIDLSLNYPWVYLEKVNGNRVKELQAGNHGYTIIFQEIRKGQINDFISITDMFKIIRKYK